MPDPAPEATPQRLEPWFKLVAPILAALTFAWGIYTYGETARKQSEAISADAAKLAETRRIEASKPFLDKQLKLFSEATAATAVISTSVDAVEIGKARIRFYELYWGELAMVERGSVERAMVKFREALDAGRPQKDLQGLSLILAHACRDELGAAWGTDAWKR